LTYSVEIAEAALADAEGFVRFLRENGLIQAEEWSGRVFSAEVRQFVEF